MVISSASVTDSQKNGPHTNSSTVANATPALKGAPKARTGTVISCGSPVQVNSLRNPLPAATRPPLRWETLTKSWVKSLSAGQVTVTVTSTAAPRAARVAVSAISTIGGGGDCWLTAGNAGRVAAKAASRVMAMAMRTQRLGVMGPSLESSDR